MVDLNSRNKEPLVLHQNVYDVVALEADDRQSLCVIGMYLSIKMWVLSK